MTFAWANMWIETFSESADKTVALYADPFLFEDLLLGQQITDDGKVLELISSEIETTIVRQ